MSFDATFLLIGPGAAVADSDTRAVADSGQRLLGLAGANIAKTAPVTRFTSTDGQCSVRVTRD
jgi:hypothetical protein